MYIGTFPPLPFLWAAMIDPLPPSPSCGPPPISPLQGALVQQYGRLALASGVGLVLGPIIGSHLGQKIDVILPVWVALGCVSMCLIIT